MFTALRLLVLASLVLIVTVACLRVDVAFIINDDGTGVIHYTLAVSDDLADYADEDALDFTEDLGDLPKGTEVREYSEDGYTGVVMSIPVDDFTGLTWLEEELDLLFDVSVVEDNGRWEFQAIFPALDETVEDELDFSLGLAEDAIETVLVEQLFRDASFQVRLSLPGELIEHNADRIEDDMLIWAMALTSRDEQKLTALTAPGGSLPLFRIILVCLFAGLVAVAIATLALRRPMARAGGRRR